MLKYAAEDEQRLILSKVIPPHQVCDRQIQEEATQGGTQEECQTGWNQITPRRTCTNLPQLSKKFVESDFKNHRVEDPTQITSRQERQVKKYVQEYFEKLVTKKNAHEKKKVERKSKGEDTTASPVRTSGAVKAEEESDGDEIMEMSEDEDTKQEPMSVTPITPVDQLANGDGLKRKRDADIDVNAEDDESTPSKRPRSITPPVPPPPPPLAMGMFEESEAMEESVIYESNPALEYTAYRANKKLDETHDMDASTYISGTPHEECFVQVANQPPPPPPPPPPEGSSSGEYQDNPIYQMVRPTNGSYETSMTPATPDDNTTDADGQGMEDLVRDHSRYIAAQESM